MKLQYASDLHLEFPENKEFLRIKPLKPVGDVLILAGDIVPFSHMNEHSDFFDYVSAHYELTYWLPGNHEYYHSDISERSSSFSEKIRENVLLVNNISVQAGKVKMIFSTLWTSISPSNQFAIQTGYSDFHVIKNGGRRLNVEDYNIMHEVCLSFLKEEFAKQKAEITVVVTHHMPTFMNYPEEFKAEIINEAFAVELSDLIREAGPEYWIFGHEHGSRSDFKISRTRLATNHLGYVRYMEFKSFDNGKFIEI